MKVQDYIAITEKTDQLEPKLPTHPDFKLMPILGLAGEIGSFLAELKKRVREPQRVRDVGTKRLEEELGDIIWYAVTIARRARLDFKRDILFANLERVSTKPSLYLPLFDEDTTPGTKLSKAIASGGLQTVDTFKSYQENVAISAVFERDPATLLPHMAKIWKNSGDLLDCVDASTSDFSAGEKNQIARTLGDVMWYAAGLATLYRLDLDSVTRSNVEKAESIFTPLEERKPTPLFDERFPTLEQFPRRFDVNFVSTDEDTAVMLINGVRLGDPLKDNAYQLDVGPKGVIDGYRFHDCIHLALVAVLGWSPVVRSLMKRKRKSDKKVDDAEDGARAQIVEEMIVKLTHSYAVSVDRNNLLRGRQRVSVDLLKQIEILAEGLEVAGSHDKIKACKLWEWERAILLGYEIFDQLRRHKRGRIRVDLETRSVTFFELGPDEGERFPIQT